MPLVIKQVFAIEGASLFAGTVNVMEVPRDCSEGILGESNIGARLTGTNRNDGEVEATRFLAGQPASSTQKMVRSSRRSGAVVTGSKLHFLRDGSF